MVSRFNSMKQTKGNVEGCESKSCRKEEARLMRVHFLLLFASSSVPFPPSFALSDSFFCFFALLSDCQKSCKPYSCSPEYKRLGGLL